MKKCLTLLLGISLGVAVAAWPTAQTAGDEPTAQTPQCGGVNEPIPPPFCGSTPTGDCKEKNPCTGSAYGDQFGYCCREQDNKCYQYTGRYKCCNNVWRIECVKTQPSENCGISGECY